MIKDAIKKLMEVQDEFELSLNSDKLYTMMIKRYRILTISSSCISHIRLIFNHDKYYPQGVYEDILMNKCRFIDAFEYDMSFSDFVDVYLSKNGYNTFEEYKESVFKIAQDIYNKRLSRKYKNDTTIDDIVTIIYHVNLIEAYRGLLTENIVYRWLVRMGYKVDFNNELDAKFAIDLIVNNCFGIQCKPSSFTADDYHGKLRYGGFKSNCCKNKNSLAKMIKGIDTVIYIFHKKDSIKVEMKAMNFKENKEVNMEDLLDLIDKETKRAQLKS